MEKETSKKMFFSPFGQFEEIEAILMKRLIIVIGVALFILLIYRLYINFMANKSLTEMYKTYTWVFYQYFNLSNLIRSYLDRYIDSLAFTFIITLYFILGLWFLPFLLHIRICFFIGSLGVIVATATNLQVLFITERPAYITYLYKQQETTRIFKRHTISRIIDVVIHGPIISPSGYSKLTAFGIKAVYASAGAYVVVGTARVIGDVIVSNNSTEISKNSTIVELEKIRSQERVRMKEIEASAGSSSSSKELTLLEKAKRWSQGN